MAAAAPLAISALSSAWAAPAIGAGVGALMNKDNRLQGALLGGLGGAFAGPALGAMGGAGAAGQAGANALAMANPGLMAGGQQAAMLAAQNAGLGTAGLNATTQALGGQLGLMKTAGLLSNFAKNPMAKMGTAMMQGGQQQQMQPQMPPQQMNPMPQQGSMAELGMRKQPYQLSRSRRI
jgi:hypothetical protein